MRAIEAAGFAMGELAKERADIDKALLNAAVKGFLEQLQVGAGRDMLVGLLIAHQQALTQVTTDTLPCCAGCVCVEPYRRRSSWCWRRSRLPPLTETLRQTTTSSCCRSVRACGHMHILWQDSCAPHYGKLHDTR